MQNLHAEVAGPRCPFHMSSAPQPPMAQWGGGVHGPGCRVGGLRGQGPGRSFPTTPLPPHFPQGEGTGSRAHIQVRECRGGGPGPRVRGPGPGLQGPGLKSQCSGSRCSADTVMQHRYSGAVHLQWCTAFTVMQCCYSADTEVQCPEHRLQLEGVEGFGARILSSH